MILIQPRSDLERDLWRAVFEIAARQPAGWTLIGAQMVMLHAWELRAVPIRTSRDLDLLVDVKTMAGGTRRLASELTEMGYELETVTPDGRGHRFVRGEVAVDVLAADNLGPRADLTTVPPARTIAIAGGSQALRRTEVVEVRLADREGLMPRPNLLGAILLKARAVDTDPDPERHLRDLAFLLSVVGNPYRLAEQITSGERVHLQRRRALLDPNHPAWEGVSDAGGGLLSLAVLLGESGRSSSTEDSK